MSERPNSGRRTRRVDAKENALRLPTPSAKAGSSGVARHFSGTGRIALIATALFLFVRPAHAQTTARLAPIEIYGSEQAAQDTRTPRDPGLRARGGIVFASGGIASNFAYNGTGGGGGLGFHLGGQVNHLIGVYLSARFDTLIVVNYAEGDVIIDFTLRDRIQVGLGLGGFATFNLYSGPGAGLVVPFHFGATPALWHMRDGSRTGLSLGLDLAPGIGFGSYYYSSIPFAFSANLSLGWEWY